jgi:hypothetical protein
MNMGQEISSLKISDDEVDHFAQTISAAWYRAAESVIDAAVSLRRAQDVLGKKQFTALRAILEHRRVMSSSTVSKLLVIAQNPTLTAPENIHLLPASYATLYDIAREDTGKVQDALATGLLTPATTHKDAKKIFNEPAARLVRSPTTKRQVASVRLTGDITTVPRKLRAALNDLLKQLEDYVEVKTTGISE